MATNKVRWAFRQEDKRDRGPIEMQLEPTIGPFEVIDIWLIYPDDVNLEDVFTDQNKTVMVEHTDWKRLYRVHRAEYIYDIGLAFFVYACCKEKEEKHPVIMRDFYKANKKINKKPVLVTIAEDDGDNFDLGSNIIDFSLYKKNICVSQINTEVIKSNEANPMKMRRIFPPPASSSVCWRICTCNPNQKKHSNHCPLGVALVELEMRETPPNAAACVRHISTCVEALLTERCMLGLLDVKVKQTENKNDIGIFSKTWKGVDYRVKIVRLNIDVVVSLSFVGFYFGRIHVPLIKRIRQMEKDLDRNPKKKKHLPISEEEATKKMEAYLNEVTRIKEPTGDLLLSEDLSKSLGLLDMSQDVKEVKKRIAKIQKMHDNAEKRWGNVRNTIVQCYNTGEQTRLETYKFKTNVMEIYTLMVHCRERYIAAENSPLSRLGHVLCDENEGIETRVMVGALLMKHLYSLHVYPLLKHASELYTGALEKLHSINENATDFTDVFRKLNQPPVLIIGPDVIYEMCRTKFPTVSTVDVVHRAVPHAISTSIKNHNRSVISYEDMTNELRKVVCKCLNGIVYFKIIICAIVNCSNTGTCAALVSHFITHCADVESAPSHPFSWSGINCLFHKQPPTEDDQVKTTARLNYHMICDDVSIFHHMVGEIAAMVLKIVQHTASLVYHTCICILKPYIVE